MHQQLNTKLSRIADNFINGNKKDASKAIRNLTKVQVVSMLVEIHQLNQGYFIGRPDSIYDLERFILLSLEGFYQ